MNTLSSLMAEGLILDVNEANWGAVAVLLPTIQVIEERYDQIWMTWHDDGYDLSFSNLSTDWPLHPHISGDPDDLFEGEMCMDEEAVEHIENALRRRKYRAAIVSGISLAGTASGVPFHVIPGMRKCNGCDGWIVNPLQPKSQIPRKGVCTSEGQYCDGGCGARYCRDCLIRTVTGSLVCQNCVATTHFRGRLVNTTEKDMTRLFVCKDCNQTRAGRSVTIEDEQYCDGCIRRHYECGRTIRRGSLFCPHCTELTCFSCGIRKAASSGFDSSDHVRGRRVTCKQCKEARL